MMLSLVAESWMKAITVRCVPDDLYDNLTALARLNRRSLQQQVLVLLDRARVVESVPVLDRAASLRRKLAGRPLGDTVSEVRAERRR
jgi:hypothetical protein